MGMGGKTVDVAIISQRLDSQGYRHRLEALENVDDDVQRR